MNRLELHQLNAQPTTDFAPAAVVEALNHCFEGYLTPVNFTITSFEQRMRGEHLDPEASKIYTLENQPVGVILVARRGWNSRIAAMSVAPDFRNQGVGRQMLLAALEAARDRHDRQVILEVFEQNPNAVRLYRSVGFQITRRLNGYQRPPRTETFEPLIEIDPLEFARIAARESDAGLPWMLEAETFAAKVIPNRAFQLESGAFALVTDTAGEHIVLWNLVVAKAFRRQGLGERLVRGLVNQFAGKGCVFLQLVPETLAPEFFAKLGFTTMEINQFEMRHPLER
jgi:ribosomal protein S18 acetylase RimI-like enzyme